MWFSFSLLGLPGNGNAGETTELLRLVPGELTAEVTFGLLPENAERFRSFGEGEEVAALELRRENFEKIPVRFPVDLRDRGGKADAINQCLPFFVVGARNDLHILKLCDD